MFPPKKEGNPRKKLEKRRTLNRVKKKESPKSQKKTIRLYHKTPTVGLAGGVKRQT